MSVHGVYAGIAKPYFRGRALYLTASCLLMIAAPAAAQQQIASVADLTQLSIEELANVQVTSVSRRPEPLNEAPAAVYVITQDDIRRSGANSVPEVLRLAPNLEVTQFGALNYAISARGFNSQAASNKLLVLIDGRSVYSTLHSGVFWDAQNTMLDDIERVEVVSGPGGTLWGANAMNGVINIVTRDSADTQGWLADGRVGDNEQNMSVRYGGALGANTTYRVYGTAFQRGSSVTATGDDTGDDWNGKQGGFRVDWKRDGNSVTAEGDLYGEWVNGNGRISGGNILTRWRHDTGADSALQVQAYFDRSYRAAPGISDSLNTYDLEIQHNFSPLAGHEIVWGGGYRVTQDRFTNIANAFVLQPSDRTLDLGNIFAQDEIALAPDVTLTGGLKIEYHKFAGTQYMPNVRLAWRIDSKNLLWAAISRAVRTPSRFDKELVAPGIFGPSPAFQPETLLAYEVGYRTQPVENVSFSVSTYYNVYDALRSVDTVGGVKFGNGVAARTYGVEAWGNVAPRDWWRLSAGVSLLHKDLDILPGSIDSSGGNDPAYQASLRSSMDLTRNLEWDVNLRVVDKLSGVDVPGYAEAGAQIAWRVTKSLTLALVGSNLLHNHHLEGLNGAPLDIPRSVYFGARTQF